ncbi:uncharacterized protein LOC117785356 [Drosophila innubila]|uniref:uncharacterized protein LOC117785356 n=1 Tax=Drosophila innubila TaxID=198719 RepID=UPI00148B3D42|nr:uncharacterized protein LOC117785356 [Drosophila innubila]
MTQELPPIVLKGKDLIKYRCLLRKYPVSREFLHRNWGNAKRFIIYALNPRCVLRNYAWRKRNNRIVIIRRARLLLFDPRLKRMIKRRKANIKQWSSNIVRHYRKMGHITEYEETELYGEELSKQMKQQLELLKNTKRGISLIEDANKNVELRLDKEDESATEQREKKEEKEEQEEKAEETTTSPAAAETKEVSEKPKESMTAIIEPLPTAKVQPISATAEKGPEKSPEKSGGSKFLDMLMNKVRVKNFANESNFPVVITSELPSIKPTTAELDNDFSFNDDTSEDFVGFDETAHQPGMLLTPLVPQSCKTVEGNSAFVSEALEAYMKKNNLRESSLDDRERLLEPMYQDGRVTAHSVPPYMDMPAVPDSLQRLRTVADRRHYLQRSKNQKMAIINNEANIYRELQRKQRQRKVKVAAMQQLQSSGSAMPFTRQGWQAASYVATDSEKYYYQVVRIDGEMVRLSGSQGNNTKREKKPHRSQLTSQELSKVKCNRHCMDAHLSNEIKVQPTRPCLGNGKLQKLNQYPLPAIFRPCPLSQKPFQKPLDDDTAALLLAGGSMAVVSMPTVQLDVKPQLGRPLDDIAKRYLQYILPHHDITREWAEFSVSTLQESPNSMREAEAQAEAQTPSTGRRRSFTFVIPYLNDRNHILVRRVVDRSEQLDDSFSAAQPPEKLQEFQFHKELSDSPDPIELACADMINDMINTVAISCSENSFISVDPDATSCVITEISPAKEEAGEAAGKTDKPNGKLANNKTTQQRRPNKQQRLAKELRRLNATIIDAGAIAKDATKPCIKEHCQLGCLCESLIGEFPLREHCGRADCVLECRCTGAELTRIMRVETDGRGLSNEDAFNLRRQATARLAKMEKDFTSTLVLTDNETLLINETQCDKKRRCTKAPKRYEDFDDSIEDDDDLVRPSKASKREISSSAKRSRGSPESGSGNFATLPSLGPPCNVKDTDFMQLKHCQVSLRRLPDVHNLASFCMVHQLYKCFCGGLAVDGKPVIIEKEESDVAITPYVPELATRAHYSFERAQEEPQPSKKRRKEKPQPQQQPKTQKSIPPPKTTPAAPAAMPAPQPPPPPSPSPPPKVTTPPPTVKTVISPQRPAELDIIFSYFRSRPHLCRRVISVPRNCYVRLNRRRIERTASEIKRSETPQTQELLNKRIANAVRFYRSELDQQRRLEREGKLPGKKQEEPFVIVVRDDSDESEACNVVAHKRVAEEDSNVEMLPKRRRQLLAPAEEAKPKQQQQSVVQSAPNPEIQMPKISSCYSLNKNAPAMDLGGDISDRTDSSGSLENTSSMDSNFRASYNDVILKMNAHVSKKMQDIDLALQRESKIIPSPNEDILCIIKWTNFLAAFESDFVFIWDVQMKNYSFLAATITNMMPAVCGAIAVVNTRFAPDPRSLCLMARMLLESKRNENTGHLAVVMQGRQQYWLVKGFLRHMEGNACTKPTPQTHPILTKKINVLCSLMVKQKIREQQKQQQMMATNSASSSASATPSSVVTPSPVMTPPPVMTPSSVVTPSPDALPTTSTSSGTASQNKETALIIRSNIEFRKVHQGDVCSLQIPELHPHDHRWVVLNLYDDFSHIFVPAFRDMISLDRIYQVVRAAHDSKKVIKLQFFKDAPYDAFVTPSSKRKIYFGPLPLDTDAPVLVLLQSVDGKMMLREVYQREHNIKVQPDRRTMAFWVLQINKQVHFEIDLSSTSDMLTKKEETIGLIGEQQLQLLNSKDKQDAANDDDGDDADDDDDDDCMIIDDDEVDGDNEKHLENTEQIQKEQPKVKQELPQEQPKQQQQRINFTIQSLQNNGGGLQITTAAPSAANSGSMANGFLPFIANVPATGKTAPNTQFLTPQVQVTQTAAMPTVSSRSEANIEATIPAKISRISVQRCPAATTAATGTGTGLATATASGVAIKEGPSPIKINESLQQLLSGGNGNIKLGTGSTGVTITKLMTKDATAAAEATTLTMEPIKIGAKRKTTEKSAMSSTIPAAAADEQTESSIRAPTILKQTATTISIGNLPMRQVRPLPAKLQQLAAGRKSLPSKQPGANEPRQSLPAKLPGTVTTARTPEQQKIASSASTVNPSKVSYGFLVAKNLPRYRVKVMDCKLIIKIPDEGVRAFKSCSAASFYLNRYLSRTGKHQSFLPGEWKFLPVENSTQKAIQQQQQQQKPLKNLSSDPIPAPIIIED